MIRLHRSINVLKYGSVMFLYCSYKIVSYGRFNRNQAVAVVLNNDYEEREVRLHVRRLGVPDGAQMKLLARTTEEGYELDCGEYTVTDNILTIRVGKISAVILYYEKN